MRFVFLIFLFAIPSAMAGPHFEAATSFQFRENTIGNRELPWLNRFRLDFPVAEVHGQFTVYGQVLSDAIRETNHSDLYQASFAMAQPALGLKGIFGRFLLSTSESIVPLDGGEVTLGNGSVISARLFGGARRHYEISAFSKESILIGGDVRVEPFSVTSVTVGYRLDDDRAGVRRQWAVAGLKQAIPVAWNPMVVGSLDYSLSQSTIGAATVGSELHPTEKLQFSADLSKFEEINDGFRWQDRIYTLFATGAQWQASGAVAYQWTPAVSFRGNYSYQTYSVLSAGPSVRGDLVRLGGRWSTGRRPFTLDGEGFFQNSYGGKVFGFNGKADKQISQAWSARGSFAVARYEKITGSDDYAIHTGLGLFYAWASGFQVGLNGEINSNIYQDLDFRAGMMATYAYF